MGVLFFVPFFTEKTCQNICIYHFFYYIIAIFLFRINPNKEILLFRINPNNTISTI